MPRSAINKHAASANAATDFPVADNAGVEKEVTQIMDIQDNDLVVCTSQIPNLSYKDYKTGDKYIWKNVGDTEEISFATLKDMYRNASSYIKNLWFTFDDDRVIKKFRLEKLYADYKDLITVTTYKRQHIARIEEIYDSLSTPIRNTILSRIKAFIASGDIADAVVIRKLEKLYDADLMSMIE